MLGSSTRSNWVGESTVCAGCGERDHAPISATHYYHRPKQQLFLVDRQHDERPRSARLALTRRTGNAHGGSYAVQRVMPPMMTSRKKTEQVANSERGRPRVSGMSGGPNCLGLIALGDRRVPSISRLERGGLRQSARW